jgi:epoxyqueuosine reductase QueG
MQDKWADNTDMQDRYKEIYLEMKEVVKLRVDWDPAQVEAMLKTLP